MRFIPFLLSVLLLVSNGRGQSLDWAWAWDAGAAGTDRAVTDVSPTGELYLLGTYEGTIDAHGTPLVSSGGTDAFVQQLDPTDGSVQWTAEAHNTADMDIFGVAYRSTGEIIVSGFVYHDGNDSQFGPFTIPGDDFGYQAFIAGLSPAGEWVWLSTVPGPTTLSTQGWMVEVDGSDDILLQCGIERVNVHKFTGAGVPVWNTMATSGTGSLDAYAMDVLPDNSLVITGRFHDTGAFGSFELFDGTIYYDAFIAKLNSAGVWEWAVQAGGSHWDKGYGVQATATGDVYVMGTYRNTATFGPFTATALPPNNDLWIAKLSGTGQWLWLNPAGATAYMEVYGMDLSADGSRIACAGTYNLAGTVLDGVSLPTPVNNFNDLYVAELDSMGNFISAKGNGGTFGDQALSVAYDADNNIYAAGKFDADMMLDTISLL
ncbi:MAG: hypothetical protein ABI432_15430 [Flavobacteriales bacterium]